MPQANLSLLILLIVLLVVVLGLIVRLLRQGAETINAPMGEAVPQGAATGVGVRNPPSVTPASTGTITSWGYQLQKLDLANAGASPFDLLVIDTTKDGSDDTALTAAELARLKRKSDGTPRRVLAYLSIGEAESYRSYWDKEWKRERPEWLLGENPEWKENYAVCFWHPGWQGLMCGTPGARLDRVLAAGFDGVYLDKCDVFEDLKRRYRTEAASRADIEGDMVQFIAALSVYAKARDPNFLIVMQNSEDLLTREDLRAVLDGVAKEELIYGGEGPEKLNKSTDFEASRAMLDLMRADSKLVLVVEYLDAEVKIQHAVKTVSALDYVLAISPKNRKLDRLNYETLMA